MWVILQDHYDYILCMIGSGLGQNLALTNDYPSGSGSGYYSSGSSSNYYSGSGSGYFPSGSGSGSGFWVFFQEPLNNY